MDSTRWSLLQDLFEAALEQDPPNRVTFLKKACQEDLELYQEVYSLLESDQQINSLVDGHAFESVTLSGSLTEAPELPAQQVGPYMPEKRLGQGGMGIVYLANRVDGQFDQQVALKLIKRGMDSELIVRRFLGERQILARLQHPNIAGLLDGGLTEDGQPYFAMEYVEGVRILAYCNAKNLNLRERLALFDQVCRAVHYAHRNLVVHRDLKPSNILLTRENEVKLLDFGIARVLTDDDADARTILTEADQRLLTPEYAAPEQVTGGAITTQTDIYSLGVVLYELLTGVRPLKFSSHAPVEVELVLRNQTPAKPSSRVFENERIAETHGVTAERISRQLRGDLDTICLKALRKEPERRYSSVEELRLDLQRFLEGRPVTAQPDAAGYRLKKFYHRNRAGVIAGVLGVLLIGVIVTVYTMRLSAARDQAQQEALKAAEAFTFLSSLFEASNPLVAKGDTLNARHMLDAGAARIQEELAGHPEVQAELLSVIGDAYHGLGLLFKAEEHYKQALALIRRTRGEYDPEAASLLQRIGDIRHSLSDFPAADSLEHATLAIQEKIYGDDHPEIAATLLKMASTQRSLGHYDQAIPLYQQAVAMNEKLLPKDDPELAWSINNLGWAYHSQGKYEEAAAAYQKAEEIQREYLGPDHPDLAYTLNNYGGLLWTTGKMVEGEVKVRESLKIRKDLYGEEHPEYIMSLNNLAGLLFRKGDYAGAEEYYRQTIEVNTRMLGPRHRYVASGLSSLGTVLLQKELFEEAEKLLLESLEIREEMFGAEHQQVINSKDRLAAVYWRWGKYEKALPLYREVLDYWRRQEAQPIEMASALVGMGAILTEQGKAEEAEPYLIEALSMRSEHFESDDFYVAEVKALLGRCLCEQGKCDQGTTYLEEAVEAFRAAGRATDRRAIEAENWLKEAHP